jgi:DNA topoisomerase VI subunit A
MTTVNDLDAKKKAMEDAMAEYEAAKKLSREQDLKMAKELIARHAFKSSDLKPELKTTRTAAKKTAAKKTSGRKS